MNIRKAIFSLSVLAVSCLAASGALAPGLSAVKGSRLIQGAAYDPATETLRIQLVNSIDVYHYRGVPPEVYEAFLGAESRGRYYAEHIKPVYQADPAEAE